MTFEEIIKDLKKKAYDSWSGGRTSEERSEKIETFVRERSQHYAEVLGITKLEVLKAWEARRDYSAINFYQDAKQPKLENCHVYENKKALQDDLEGELFQCPSCEHHTKNPYECDYKDCDWKVYGFLDFGSEFILLKDTPPWVPEKIFKPVKWGPYDKAR